AIPSVGRFGKPSHMKTEASARRAVADRDVAANTTVRLVCKRAVMDQIADETFVTLYAVALQDAGILLVDADRFVKILQREARGVPEAVLGLGDPLRQALVRQMTIHARGIGVMAGSLPAFKLIAHDVTVDARIGIAAEVRGALGVPERVQAEADEN